MSRRLLIILFLSCSTGVRCEVNITEEIQGGESRMFEGDIAVRPDSVRSKERSVGDTYITNEARLWPQGVVRYKIDKSSIVDEEHHLLIKQGLEELQEIATCLQFNEIDGPAVGDHILFSAHGDGNYSGAGCWSYVGRQGGQQVINLEPTNCMSLEHIKHEVIHSLGGIHEHSRPDRDEHIRVVEENIQKGKLSNFNISQWDYDDDLKGVDTLGAPYDLYSLMHYPHDAFGINGSRTIEALDRNKINIGTTGYLTITDIIKINLIYQCDIKSAIIIQYIHKQLGKDDSGLTANILQTIEEKTDHFEEENNALQEKIQIQEQRMQTQDQRIHQLESDNSDYKDKLNVLMWKVQKMENSFFKFEQKYEESILKYEENIIKVQDKLEDHEMESKVILSRLETKVAQEIQVEDTVEDLTLLNIKRSCQEYADVGITRSGYFLIDPDGPLKKPNSIRVWCTMTPEGGVTEILHDSENTTNISRCSQPGCYTRNITYESSYTQIQALMGISGHCAQHIRYDCTMAPLSIPLLNIDYGYWYGADGKKNVHWDDTSDQNDSSHSCACNSKPSKCFRSEMRNKCNCDSRVAKNKFDMGTITRKSSLPVIQLRFGGLEFDYQVAQHTLGRLKCTGRNIKQPGSSCESIRLSGNYMSSFYTVKQPNQNSKLVYCNMTVDTGSNPDMEIFVESASEQLETIQTNINVKFGELETNQTKTHLQVEELKILKTNTIMQLEELELLQTNTSLQLKELDMHKTNTILKLEELEIHKTNTNLKLEELEKYKTNINLKLEEQEVQKTNTNMKLEELETNKTNINLKLEEYGQSISENDKDIGFTTFECSGIQKLKYTANITSPNYPSNYPANVDCSFVLVPRPGHSVYLEFTVSNIHSSNCDCYGDYIGIDPPINYKSTFCGGISCAAPITTFDVDQQVIVRFVTRPTVDDHSGWNAIFSIV